MFNQANYFFPSFSGKVCERPERGFFLCILSLIRNSLRLAIPPLPLVQFAVLPWIKSRAFLTPVGSEHRVAADLAVPVLRATQQSLFNPLNSAYHSYKQRAGFQLCSECNRALFNTCITLRMQIRHKLCFMGLSPQLVLLSAADRLMKLITGFQRGTFLVAAYCFWPTFNLRLIAVYKFNRQDVQQRFTAPEEASEDWQSIPGTSASLWSDVKGYPKTHKRNGSDDAGIFWRSTKKKTAHLFAITDRIQKANMMPGNTWSKRRRPENSNIKGLEYILVVFFLN